MLSSDFIIVWRQWLRRPVPATNFRNGRTGSPAYEIEHDIDHSVTYVQGLVESLIAGKDLDFKVLASKERAEIEQIVAKLSGSELNADEKQKYLSYLSDMTFILREVERTGSVVSPLSICIHIKTFTKVKLPHQRVCEECVKIGSTWVS